MNAKLANLGPKSEAMMRRAGITTEEQLRAVGAVRAYVMVKRSGANASLNLLWALEGALTNRSWQEVAKTERLSLLLQVEQLMSADSMCCNSRSSDEEIAPIK
jgi:DNA transformation protein